MMHLATFDYVVVGAGISGTSLAHALLKSGASIALVDPILPGRGGATSVSGGFVRALHETLQETALAAESFAHFERHPERHAFSRVGHLLRVTPRRLAELGPCLDVLRHHGIPFHILTRKDPRIADFSLLWNEDDLFLYEPLAGFADPRRSVDVLLSELTAMPHAAHVCDSVRAVRCTGKTSSLELSSGALAARTVVFALGGSAELHSITKNWFNAPAARVICAFELNWPGSIPHCFNDSLTGIYARPLDANSIIAGVPTGMVEVSDSDRKFPARAWLQLQEKWQTLTGRQLSRDDVKGVRLATDSPLLPPPLDLYLTKAERFPWFLSTGMGGGGYKLFPALARRASNFLNRRNTP